MATARVDSAVREIAATPAEVFAALTSARSLEAWLAPRGMTGRVETLDPRPGGRFRMTLTYAQAGGRGKSTSDSDMVDASFDEVVPGERVTWLVRFESDDPSFAGIMRMKWILQAVAIGTRVTVRAEDVPPGIDPVDHDAGLTSSLANLAAFLEGRPG